jgi:hypothetical protein
MGFPLEGMMIAIVGTQYWDLMVFMELYPRAYEVHRLMNQPKNVKSFIIGRQFFVVLTNSGINSTLFFIGVKSGLMRVMVTFPFTQMLLEILVVEYSLRFMNIYGCYSFCSILIAAF